MVEIAAAADKPRDEPGPCGERLQRALVALPLEQREVIMLKIDGELTFAQIAQVIGASMNTAASRYRYALEKLRKLLEETE
jgi:RNA polymerase sigma-70 factor (ECF subfamily)